MSKTYRVNEVFYSIQGEGVRAGTANVFIRFSGCNLRCSKDAGPKSPGGFDCDTEFESGRSVTLEELDEWIMEVAKPHFDLSNKDYQKFWLILTGGEPALQVDQEFCKYFHDCCWRLAIETNGSVELLCGETVQPAFDWITVSPKVAEHCIRQTYADEVKYVRGYGQAIPKTVVAAEHYLISPAFEGNELDQKTLDWCIKLVKENPKWRLSLQQHKEWKVR